MRNGTSKSPLRPPPVPRLLIPLATTVLHSLVPLCLRSSTSSHSDLTPLQGYRMLVACHTSTTAVWIPVSTLLSSWIYFSVRYAAI